MEEVRIELNDTERAVFKVLQEVAAGFSNPPTLRAAGGWVRDKVLGRTSHDIDVALDNTTGSEFAEAVRAYLELKGMEAHKVAVIRSNPEQSKHLETATMKVLGLPIDFANLRSEAYSAESRIPQIHIGTPKEDAERRDLTINSLFFNITTGKIEDQTMMGIRDIRDGIIRTPLEPLLTFTDDPLRVLRSVRFAARLGFRFDESLVKAASHDSVKDSLRTKISRERIGKELGLILANVRVAFAMRTIRDWGLWDVVFAIPPAASFVGELPFVWDSTAACGRVAYMERYLCEREDTSTRETTWRWMFLAAALLQLHQMEYLNNKRRRIPVLSFVVLESLKYSNRDIASVSSLVNSAVEFAEIARAAPETWRRSAVGMAVRRAGKDWPHALGLAIVAGMPRIQEADLPTHSTSAAPFAAKVEEVAVLNRVSALGEAIATMGLSDAWDMKPFFTGQEIASEILKKSPGPWISQALESEIEWQFANPAATKEQCQAWILEQSAH